MNDIIDRLCEPDIWLHLSRSTRITPAFVEQNLDKPWDWSLLSQNPIFGLKFIFSHLTWLWDWFAVSINPNIADFPAYNSSFLLSWRHILLRNSAVTLDMIGSFPNDRDWYWNASINHNLTEEFVRQRLDKPWHWVALAANPGLDPAFLIDHLNYFGVYALSSNPRLTEEFVAAHRDKKWDFDTLAKRFDPQFLKATFPEKWPQLLVEANPNLSLELDDSRNWDWSVIMSSNKAVEDLIRKAPELNMNALSINVFVTEECILKHVELAWNRENLSQNPNISVKFALEQTHSTWTKNWDWTQLLQQWGGTIEQAKQYKELSLPRVSNWSEVCHKVYDGVPLHISDYYAAKLALLILLYPRPNLDGPVGRFCQIAGQMPPELREKICAAVYGQVRITAKTLNQVIDGEQKRDQI